MAIDLNDDLLYEIDLDLHNKALFPSVPIKQYDQNAGWIVATIWDNGSEYIIPNGTVAQFACTKPISGLGILNAAIIENNKIYYKITLQTTVEQGNPEAEFRLGRTSDSVAAYSTPKFKLNIEKSALQDGTILSTSEINVLTELIAEAHTVIDTATTVIENAELATEASIIATNNANDAISNVENVISDAEEATNNATEKASLANDAAILANEKAELANDATLNANNATLNTIEATLTANEAIDNVNETNNNIQDSENIRQNYYNAYKVNETYNNSATYYFANKVVNNGSSFQCIVTSTVGNPPNSDGTDNTQWKCIARKGSDGAGGDMFKCYNIDTDILTEKGFINIQNITHEDKVATLNSNDNTILYQPVKNIYRYDNVEHLYEISNQQIDLSVTLNHNMFVKPRNKSHFGLYEAKDIIGKRVEYKKDGLWIGEYKPFVYIEDVAIPIEVYAEFMGYYLSEGCTINAVNGKGSKDYLVCVTQVKEATKSKMLKTTQLIANLLKRNAFVNNKSNFKISDKRLYGHLVGFGKSYEKYIPKSIMSSSSEIIKIFLEAYIDGDGTRNNANNRKTEKLNIFTTSVKMVDQLQELALKAGWSANYWINSLPGRISYIKNRPVISRHICYTISINKKKNTPMVNHGHVKTQKIQNEGIVPYGGSVVCVEVEKYNTLYVRRNGKGVWSGNSIYDTNNSGVVDNAEKVSNHTVEKDVPSDAKFTDTVYMHPISGVEVGTYKKVTVNVDGHVTEGFNPTATETLTDLGITSSVDEINYVNGVTSSIQAQLDNKTGKSTSSTTTLISTSWTGSSAPYSYTVTLSGVTATNMIEILPQTSITSDQVKALADAMLVGGTQENGSFILFAFGTKPSVDLPLSIVVRRDL